MAGNTKHLWALAAFVAIPVIFATGGALLLLVDPEKLAGHTHYVRNFRLLQLARGGVMLAMFGAVVVAWFVTCFLVLRAKRQPYGWLLLGFLGPFGLAILVALRDLSPEPADLYERLIRRLHIGFRVVYEIGFFLLGWTLAWQMMTAKREITLAVQSAVTGLPRQQILDQQNDQSAMWAVSELNDVMYFFVLLYLLRPVCVNVAGALLRSRGPSPVA